MKIAKRTRKITSPMLMTMRQIQKEVIQSKVTVDSEAEVEIINPVEFYEHLGNKINILA